MTVRFQVAEHKPASVFGTKGRTWCVYDDKHVDPSTDRPCNGLVFEHASHELVRAMADLLNAGVIEHDRVEGTLTAQGEEH